MDIAGRSVAVTGAGGFIGSHLVEALLERGCRVRAVVKYNSAGSWGFLDLEQFSGRPGLQVVAGNVEDPGFVDHVVDGCDVVFHLAALISIPYSYRAPHSYVATNVVGTLNVLDACRRHRVVRMVHTSTSEAYGTARYTPIDEEHPLQGQSPYSASKIAADKLAESYFRSFGLPVATLRPFNTFGPRQSARAIIPTIITQALTSAVLRLGALSPVRDLTFVEDTARAFVACAESDDAVGRVVNAGNGRGITIGDLAARVLGLMGKAGECRIELDESRLRPDNSEVFELVCDNRLAQGVLRWQPTVSLDEGLRRTVDYVQANLGRFKSHIYAV